MLTSVKSVAISFVRAGVGRSLRDVAYQRVNGRDMQLFRYHGPLCVALRCGAAVAVAMFGWAPTTQRFRMRL